MEECSVCGKPVTTKYNRATFTVKRFCKGGYIKGGHYKKSKCQIEGTKLYQRDYRKRLKAAGMKLTKSRRYYEACYDDAAKYVEKFAGVKGERVCLKCDRLFPSEGTFNRVCNRCKSRAPSEIQMPADIMKKMVIGSRNLDFKRMDELGIIKGV